MRLLLLALSLVLDQSPQPAPKRPVEIRGMVDRARALPPEFAADLLLKLATSPLVAEREWKRELIEEAFTVGARAQMPYPQNSLIGVTDSRAFQQVSRNDLEALTLQVRAVQAMLALDPRRALALFQDIAAPELPRRACRDVHIPDLAPYFETAAALFAASFTPEQRRKEDDIYFLRQRIAALRSPSQVVPVLRLLFAVTLTPPQREDLVAAFAAALDRISAGDREFSAFESQLVPSALPEWRESALFVPALRSYIVRHASGARCADSVKSGPISPAVSQFNKLTARLKPQREPISADEVKPLRIEETYKNQFPWQSPRSKQVLEALRWLNHGNRKLPDSQRFWTLEERSTPEWNARYTDLLKLLEGWKEDEEETPEDYLFMVANTYSTLAALVPPGPARDNCLGIYLNFLETRYASAANRNHWFAQLRQLLNRARGAKDAAERRWFLDRMAASPNAIISAYAQFYIRAEPRP